MIYSGVLPINPKMNKLQDILALTHVARSGSFTGAAKILGCTPSSLTKAVSRLEGLIGVKLLHRSTRAVTLTRPGERYLRTCEQILMDLAEAENELRDSNKALVGSVRICVPPSFGRLTLVPSLGRFYEANPHVRIELHMKGNTANPVDGGYDLSVHSGRLLDSRLINRLLIRGPQKVVAAPEYLERYGTPLSPEDLPSHNCIVGGFGPSWRFSQLGRPERTVRVSGSFVTDSGDGIREAAVQGLGIAQATWWLFKEDISSGRLVSVLENHEIEADPISIVLPSDRKAPATVRVLVDFLIELCR